MPMESRHSASGLAELAPMIGVGAGDFQHAVAAEVERILNETKGDVLAQHKILDRMLHERGLISDDELEVISRLTEAGHHAGAGKKDAHESYFESRDLYNKLLASGKASPVALVIASSAVGSYEITQGSGGARVAFAKKSGDWQGRGQKIGALVGAYWGPAVQHSVV
jgi:hypothetical protein